MTLRFAHRLECSALRRALLVSVVAACLAGPFAGSALGARPRARRHAASPYPAAALRPARIARASEFASSRPRAHAAARKARKPRKPVLHGDPARALVAYEAMQKAYYITGSGLYEGEPFSYLWPFSQAFAATVSLANVPHMPISFAHEIQVRLQGLNSYLDTDNSGAPEGTFTSTLAAFDATVAPPAGPGGTKYYDDNDWIGIELMRAYELTHESALLGSAEGLMAFEMASWQASPELACPGGIPFSNSSQNTERNTVTTAPAAELAVQLYRATHESQYLQFAESAYQWVRNCLLEPDGLFADHINAQGTIEPMVWSYNQGSMIGAATLLYQATRNGEYLYQARQIARAALAYFTPERLATELPFFPAVYFRNVMYLDSITHDPPGAKLAQTYVDYAWQHLRLGDNLFVYGSPPASQLLVQAAYVQIYALLSSPPSTYF